MATRPMQQVRVAVTLQIPRCAGDVPAGPFAPPPPYEDPAAPDRDVGVCRST